MWNEDGEIESQTDGMGAELANVPAVTMSVTRAPEGDGMLALMVRSAQGLERSPAKLIARAKQIGGLLGASGFYSFPAGGGTVEGPSIDMAQALAQEWGGIVYQVHIVHAEPLASGGQRVHLRASVADMRSLVVAEVDQVVSTAPAPGKFAQKADQRERWNGMQVQSAASKIVRNAILRVLPAWYVDPAFHAAMDVDGKSALDGKTLEEARAAAVANFEKRGITVAELEQHLGQPIDLWAVPQLSALRDLFFALRDAKISVESWRANLAEKDPQQAGKEPRRSALGLPAASTAAAVEVPAAKPAAEPVAAKASKKTEATQSELPGAKS